MTRHSTRGATQLPLPPTTRSASRISTPTKIMIVEDEGLFRDMLRASLASQTGIEVVGDVADGEGAILMARDLEPDVIIMDMELAGEINGIEAGLRIKQENPGVGIVVLSLHGDKEYLASLPLSHAEGWSYLMKQTVSDLDALTRAIEGAAAGLMVLDPALVIGLRPKPKTRLEALTVRQREVIELMAQGFSNSAVAERLMLGVKSVENYINAIYQHLGIRQDEPIHPRVKAVLMFLQESGGNGA